MAVLAAGTDSKELQLDGIACVVGTGCIAVGCQAGHTARCGGWGPAFSECGGGLHIGLQALRHTAACRDSKCPDELGEAVMLHAGARSAADLLRWAYADAGSNWARVASLAPAVLQCAASSGIGAAATRIVRNAAAAAAANVVTVHQQLNAGRHPAHTSCVVIAGGLVSADHTFLCQRAAHSRSKRSARVSHHRVLGPHPMLRLLPATLSTLARCLFQRPPPQSAQMQYDLQHCGIHQVWLSLQA